MNIIFLDIDGVFLTYRPEKYFEKISYGCNWDVFEVFLKLLEKSIVPTKIVMISTIMISNDPFKKFNRYHLLKERFIQLLHPECNSLVQPYLSGNRGLGIEKWLETYGQDVEKFVVIDDSFHRYFTDNNLPNLKSKFYLIPCNTSYGMQWIELRLLELFLAKRLSPVNKDYIRQFLSHGFGDDIDIRKFWKNNILPKIE